MVTKKRKVSKPAAGTADLHDAIRRTDRLLRKLVKIDERLGTELIAVAAAFGRALQARTKIEIASLQQEQGSLRREGHGDGE